jgi:hypothetical protein
MQQVAQIRNTKHEILNKSKCRNPNNETLKTFDAGRKYHLSRRLYAVGYVKRKIRRATDQTKSDPPAGSNQENLVL